MESLSRCLSASPPLLNPQKSTPKTHVFLSNYTRICNPRLISFNSLQTLPTPTDETQTPYHTSNSTSTTTISPHNCSPNLSFLKPQFTLPFLGFTFPISCFASETTTLPTEDPGRINLESILVSIDNFFNRYPFFVATVVFIWLVVIPLTEEYLQKYKFISAFNAFKKLQDDPSAQLLDIRARKSIASLGSPNLKLLSKKAVQVEFREGDEDGFVKRVLENFGEPANTTLCILDNFDGVSMKVAELLVKNGFKEAYAIRGGIRGNKGWQEIQETLLPPSVHVYPKKRTKVPKQLDTNGGISRDENKDLSLNTGSPAADTGKIIKNDSVSPITKSKGVQKPQSPYPNV
ncbi:Rhodanese/Cell cycle control phosphatase superfamily protein [Perilla frutescens var. hirtella]|uniref:Rhodanese/Cell cycle control phosphatase superfamily protein n=1 Tax=Perilla frutescens var. hirtella TaxID=608512 RepID=A0AAD4J6Y1_PERFH|nr:Rhodanese/Cell cycle control phosphatase superfamily protein [Perilla frutescens var. hirtella]